MNQIRIPATPDSICSIDDRQRDTIEYDDGNPATIVPQDDRRDPRDAGRRNDRAAMSVCCFRAPLAEIGHDTMIEYDDGNPATIAADA